MCLRIQVYVHLWGTHQYEIDQIELFHLNCHVKGTHIKKFMGALRSLAAHHIRVSLLVNKQIRQDLNSTVPNSMMQKRQTVHGAKPKFGRVDGGGRLQLLTLVDFEHLDEFEYLLELDELLENFIGTTKL